jgi:hypothetical protein
MYYAKTRADNSGYTNHRVTCLVVMGSFSKTQRYPFETWNTCSLSKEEPITTRQMAL